MSANRSWESTFASWASPPSDAEQQRCERVIRAIREAVNASAPLNQRKVLVFVQGSYRNRVNVRAESDVDVGVMLHDYFLGEYPTGRTASDFDVVDANYSYGQFKDDLEAALVSYFGRAAVTRGRKAFDIKARGAAVEADVVPLFEFRQYWDTGSYRAGVALVPDNSYNRIENYPERLLDYWPHTPQHYENGVSKNDATSRRYKSMVRILKRIRIDLLDTGSPAASAVPGYLLECLAWNAPNTCFDGSSWEDRVESTLAFLWQQTKDGSLCSKWLEVDGIKYLFHSSQPWTSQQAHAFINAAWDYVGVRST